MGFTHVELLPIAEHPFGGSWGYQVSSYYAPTSRYGSPDDLRWFVDHLHQRGIGVIVDWVPAHFPRDEWALARFDGTALYEHADPRRGAQPDWGTLVFNFGRNEVRNFLVANALYWIEEFHIDGLRVDAVASMLYLDYSRKPGEWVPNQYGGRENLEAIAFIKRVQRPGAQPPPRGDDRRRGVRRRGRRCRGPPSSGGLGFTFKWNMGWMHDTLDYISKDPIFRRYHQQQLTFGLWYAWAENFILPLSHDEVVHLKASLIGKMPGDRWQQLRQPARAVRLDVGAPRQEAALHGRRVRAVGGVEPRPLTRLAPARGARPRRHAAARRRPLPRLQGRSPRCGRWTATARASAGSTRATSTRAWSASCASTPRATPASPASPTSRPTCTTASASACRAPGAWREVINTDAGDYGGSGVGNLGRVETEPMSWHGFEQSALMTVPPLGVVWLAPEE